MLQVPTVIEPLEGLLAGLRLGLGAGAGDPEGDTEALSRIADWNAVAALAERHRVAPLLLQGIRARGIRARAAAAGPASGIEPRLEKAAERSVRRGLAQAAALKRATGLLDAAGIPCLVLKGLSLGQRLYGHPLARDARDVDLLVSPGTFRAAERVLLGNGWRRVKPNFRETPARNRWDGRFRKEHVLAGPGGLLDLHRRLSHNPFWFDVPFERLHAGCVTMETGVLSFKALGPEDEFVYLMCHGARHYWKRLMWLCDVAAILATMGPERLERVSARCRRHGLQSVLASTLFLCREAFHVGLPRGAAALPAVGTRAAWVVRFSRRTWNDEDATRFDGGFDWAGQKVIGLLTKPRPKAILHEAASVFVGPRDWGRLDLPDRWFYLYFPLRPLLWLIRREGGRKPAKRPGAERAAPPAKPAEGGRLPPPDGRTGGRFSKSPSDSHHGLSDSSDSKNYGRVEKLGPDFEKPPGKGKAPEAGGRGRSGSGERDSSAEVPGGRPRPAAGAGMGRRFRRTAKAVRAFVRAPFAAKAMALEAALLLLLARLLVKYVPMRHWRHRLVTSERPGSGGARLPLSPVQRLPRRAAHVVRVVARHVPFPAVCLPQAMALQWMLRRRGVESRLTFGARRKANGPNLDFHAWLTVGGECVIGGGELMTYTVLPPFDGVGSRPG